MKYTKKYEFRELITYVVLWTALFIAPVLTLYFLSATDGDGQFPWHEVFRIWKTYAVFLALFLLHNALVAPMLVYRQKRWAYFAAVAVMTACFVVYQCSSRPPEPRFEVRGEKKELPMAKDEVRDMSPPPPDGKHSPERPPLLMGQHDVISVIIFILMIGMNLGVKLYFKSTFDTKKMAKLKHKSLEQQLEYLKYQINPHFFMNTLNNIHALVDIDPEQSKEMIVVLSKIMRYVLYEGDRQVIPLSREVAFIDNYVQLMRMRYTEEVDIRLDIQQPLPEGEVPPLMLITFVENAFKHGVSYQHPSFINISLKTSGDTLRFCCQNSKHQEQRANLEGGIGLANVKQRLNLLYEDNYTLNIKEEESTYEVNLEIPNDKVFSHRR